MVKNRVDIIFDQTTYIAGGTLTGLVIVHVAEEYRASAVEVTLRAMEWIHFGHTKDEHVHYEDSYVLHHPGSSSPDPVTTEEAMAAATRPDAGYDVLHKGRHIFPFTFSLPVEGLPSCFGDSKRCGMQYLVTANVRHLDKEKELLSWREARVVENLQLLHSTEQPRRATAYKTFAGELQNLSVDIETNKTWYMAGEPMYVALRINNRSDERVKGIKVRFIRRIAGKTASFHKQKEFFDQVFDWADLEVLPFSHRQLVLEVQTPRNGVSIWNSSLFTVDWMLQLSCMDSSSIENIKVEIPIRLVAAASYNSMFFPSLTTTVCPFPDESALPITPLPAAPQKAEKVEVMPSVFAIPSGITSSVVITSPMPEAVGESQFYDGSYLHKPSQRKHSIASRLKPSTAPPAQQPRNVSELPGTRGREQLEAGMKKVRLGEPAMDRDMAAAVDAGQGGMSAPGESMGRTGM